MDYALWLLSRRDMSEFEILKKLHLKAAKADAFSEEEKEDAQKIIIVRLKELGLINDEKFARMFLRSKMMLSPLGKFAAISKLARKGITKNIAEKAWEGSAFDDDVTLERACQSFIRKKGAIDSDKQKQRLIRFLASRGFKAGMIYEKVARF
ncbi:MAG: Regulatory protein RecX [Candidatus Peregrinibacteria bacterium GW2011_GWF2_43_17]|nr:MAG: Regulatory protein RecX [Candidatus Peregrinibacteria bacterium GW2011_GWF2_43_17]